MAIFGLSLTRTSLSQLSSGLCRFPSHLSTVLLATVVLLQFHQLPTTRASHHRFSCERVREVYGKRVDVNTHVPRRSIPESTLDVCSDTLSHTSGASCCTPSMEAGFLRAAPEYLREHIQMSNAKLRNRIIESNRLFKDHLRQTLSETRDKTSTALNVRFLIPESEHGDILDDLVDRLNRFFEGSDKDEVEKIVHDFYADIFPLTVKYVLPEVEQSHVHQQSRPTGKEFDSCVRKLHDEIEPFGSMPASTAKLLKHAFLRARVFSQSLDVLATAVEMADKAIGIDQSCSRAVSHLQFCSMCAAKEEQRPCRGLCLNVMRGCLSKASEVSSSWDDLVVAFQKLNMGMITHHSVQDEFSQLDTNVTDAIMRSMDEAGRIYNDVMSVCRHTATDSLPSSITSHGAKEDVNTDQSSREKRSTFSLEADQVVLAGPTVLQLSKQHIARQRALKAEQAKLINSLEESKGFLHRLPDSLCRVRVIYDQEMDSGQCWNGSAVGRYMNFVPEENMISQLQNKEVNVTLTHDREVLEVKDKLAHMKKVLTGLLSDEMMLQDESYKRIDATFDSSGSSGGYYIGVVTDSKEVIIDDDEDYTHFASGSGSGDYGPWDGPSDPETPTATHKPDKTTNKNKNKASNKGKKSTSRPDTGSNSYGKNTNDKDAASSLSTSFTLLIVALLTSGVMSRVDIKR